MALALRTQQEYAGYEITVERPDGTRRAAVAHANPIYDEAGRLLGAVNVLVDITHQKQAEAALREAVAEKEKALTRLAEQLREHRRVEELNRRILDSTPDCIKVLDLDAHLLFLSLRGQCMLEVADVQQVLGAPWFEFWHGEDRAAAEDAVAAAKAGGMGRFRGYFETLQTRQPKWWDVVVTPIPGEDGRPERLLAISRDVTEHREIEHALRESHRRLQLLTETAAEALRGGTPQEFISAVYHWLKAELGLDVFFHYQLPAGSNLLQLAAYSGISEELSEALTWLPLGSEVCGQVAQQAQPLIAECVLESRAPETELIRSLGITAYACHPLIAQERVIGTLSFGTRRRSRFTAEEVALMRAVSDQVASALERWLLETELKSRAEELAETDRRKDQFLSMLAHELRNPLAAAGNAVAVLGRTLPDAPAYGRALEVLQRQIRHQSRIVDDLLDVSRINNGRLLLRFETVNLAALLHETLLDYQPRLEESQVLLSVEAPAAPIWLSADPTRLVQVIGNLLDNAVKFTRRGGTIRVQLQETAAGEARLAIRDSGMGIPPELLPRIFQPFIQADQSLDRSAGGLGLGLPVVKGLVELHQGRVDASSEGLGQGAEFVVWLPLAASSATGSARVQERPGGRPVRILVVDDNRDAADMLRDLLEYYGYEVTVAYSGPEAIERARATTPDVVLCDIGLPVMDGYAVAATLRADPATASAALISVSGYGDERYRQRSLAAGFQLHLVKPVGLEELQQALAQVQVQGTLH